MVSADRQLIMETNRSLRNIKTELESLLEKGVIDEALFDELHATLPEESPLSGPLRTATGKGSSAASTTSAAPPPPAARTATNATPVNRQPVVQPPPGSPPREQVLFDSSRNENNGANFHNALPTRSPAPPSYEDTPPPQMPPRSGKPVIAWARALYPYNASDGRDCSFNKDDKIAVHEYMNQDWWMGQNLRTGQEGIFPRNYVFVEHQEKPPVPQQPRQQPMPPQPQYGYPQQQYYPPGPPPQQNPYNAAVPPMAVAQGSGQPQQPQQEAQESGGNKVGEFGKKVGGKLGNAAIFGAGATLGGNLVNSIF